MTPKEIHALKVERDAIHIDRDGQQTYDALTARIDAAEQSVGGKVFRVPAVNLPELQKQIERINKRAAKIDAVPVELVEASREHVESTKHDADGEEFKVYTEFVYVVLYGETPRVAGFEFVATLEHDDAGTLVRRVPTFGDDEFDLTEYRTAEPICEHCQTKRKRKDTYVVRNAETGETRQVGRQCLKDYTGAHNPEQVARFAEYLRDLVDVLGGDWDEHEGGGGGGESHYSTLDVLAVTDKAIREFGWISKSKAGWGATATAEWVERLFTSRTLDADLKRIVPDDDARTKAQAVLDWVRSDEFIEKSGTSDYFWNLGVALQSDYTTFRRFGLVASAVSAYDREREYQLRHAAETQQRSEREHVGEVGKREVFELKLVRIIWIEDRYNPYGGSKPLYIFQDADGNEVKWFASNTAGLASQVQIGDAEDPQYAFEAIAEGFTYRVKATVKAHDDHPQYGKATLITRAKIEALIGAPEEVTA